MHLEESLHIFFHGTWHNNCRGFQTEQTTTCNIHGDSSLIDEYLITFYEQKCDFVAQLIESLLEAQNVKTRRKTEPQIDSSVDHEEQQ